MEMKAVVSAQVVSCCVLNKPKKLYITFPYMFGWSSCSSPSTKELHAEVELKKLVSFNYLFLHQQIIGINK